MQKFENVWGEILAQSWSDPAYRQQVAADPTAVLKARGIEVPEGVVFSVAPVENTTDLHSSVLVLPFPERPAMTALGAGDPPPPPNGGGSGGGGGASCCSSSVLCCCCCP